MDNLNIPNKIMVSRELEDEEALEEWLGSKTTHKVTIHSPKKGTKLRFVEMADKNSKVTLENKEKTIESILVELKDKLQMDKLPRKIENYDISNISGEFMVAAMCVMEDGTIKRICLEDLKLKP